MSFCCFIFFFTFFLLKQCEMTVKLQEQFGWSIIDFDYKNDFERRKAILTKRYIPENNLPVGIEIWGEKLFVTVPRWRVGVPSTLNYIPLNNPNPPKSPLLIPYPSWSFNEFGNCESALTNVYRLQADSCNRLWVLDTGTFGIGNTTQHPCPYALNIFDLITNQRLRRYELRPEDTTPNTFIANIVIDVGVNCDDAFAYMSDELGYGLLVYSWSSNTSWRFKHGFFQPDPLAGLFQIDGIQFQWESEGIFGMSLSPVLPTGNKILYFSPLASFREFAVSTKILKNPLKVNDSYFDFVALAERGPHTHVTAQVMSHNGIQLFNLIDRNAIGCWNWRRSYEMLNIGVVDHDDQQLIFPSDIKIDIDELVWVISDKMSTFLESELDYTDINFRIFFAPLNVLTTGTVCDVKPIVDDSLYF